MDQLVETLFTRMDNWRHFPDYQLERRADIFFSLYLPHILTDALGCPIAAQVIPEFPIRIGLGIADNMSHQSKKVDFLAFTIDFAQAIFVELKTDNRSVNHAQRAFYSAIVDRSFSMILSELVTIFSRTDKNARMKYFQLLLKLEELGQIQMPPALKELVRGSDHRGLRHLIKKITYNTRATTPSVVYIQPCKDDGSERVITFDDVACSITNHFDDPFSQRFAQSIREWGCIEAGARV